MFFRPPFVSQLLNKLSNLQSSMSKFQEQSQRLQQKNKRLEEQTARMLQEKRLQRESEKSWKHQTTMTEQKQVYTIILSVAWPCNDCKPAVGC